MFESKPAKLRAANPQTPIAKAISVKKLRRTVRPPLQEAHADVALCDIADLEALTRMSKSWISEAVRTARFPAPVIRQPRCTRWKVADVRDWLIQRTEQAIGDTSAASKLVAAASKASAAAKAKRVEKKVVHVSVRAR